MAKPAGSHMRQTDTTGRRPEPKVGYVSANPLSGGEVVGSQPRPAGRRRRHPGKVIAVVIAVVAVVYVVGSVAFMNVFLPGTTLNGTDVSLKSTSAVASTLTDQTGSYASTVTGDGIDITIKGSDIGLSFDADAYVKQAISGINAWAWPIEAFQKRDLGTGLGVTFDQDKLTTLVSDAVDAVNATATQPVNATIAYDQASSKFTVQPETYGTAIDKDLLVSEVSKDIDALEASITLGDESLLKPAVLKDDATLAESAAKANAYLTTTLTLNSNGTVAATVDAATIKDWVAVDGTNVSVSLDAVKAWTQGTLSTQLDTVGTSRTYTRADGVVITVTGGTYGRSIDGETLAQTIVDDLNAGTSASVDIPMLQEDAVYATQGQPDWGPSYVDVDLTNQHVRYYDASGTLVWESDCVSGDTTEDHGTPEGVYAITSYMSSGNVKLTGATDTATGEPEYISYVDYWMPFIGNGYALHDASWRSSFGGTVYEGNGSHGCVNLPSSKAAELYGMVSVGTPVVVHY